MERIEIKDKLVEILKDIFDDEELVITEKTSPKDIEDWDSLANINIVLQIEKYYKIKFSIQDIGKLNNIEEIIDFIMERVK